MLSKKVVLTGNFGVGKTSLFNRFINNTFDDKYLTTIGVKVNKKAILVDDQEVSLLLWDVAGEVKQDKVPTSYFLGAASIIYVFDLSRPRTYESIQEDIDYLKELLPNCVIKVVGNKVDLVDEAALDTVKNFFEQSEVSLDITTSAKTGENIEALLQLLGKELIA